MPISMSNNKGNVGVEGKDVRNATVATRLDSKGSLRKQARGTTCPSQWLQPPASQVNVYKLR
jgi:hypothetical protein